MSNRAHYGALPATVWLSRLPLTWKIILAAGLASSSLGALIFSVATSQAITTQMALIFGGLTLLSWYLLASLFLTLTGIFRELQEANSRLEKGDFGVRMVPAATPEGGQLARRFNDVTREVGRIVAEIRAASTEVAHATVELNKNAGLVADAANQQGDSASHTAAAVEQMTVSITEVASQSKEAEQTSHMVSELAAEGRRAISSSSGEIQSLAHAVNEVSQLMDHLAQRSSEVNQATGLIRDISDQTNLLALNAAIEAARAGESGRGFAVVADEVRKLAQRARTSADEITSTVAAIQTEVQQAVVHMAKAGGKAQESVTHANGVREVLSEIDMQAIAALDRVHQIASATQQQSSSSTEIARHVEQIADSAQINSHAAAETAEMAAHLAYLASGMRTSLANFRG
ncbi:MAG TPA: methyl-accepting chemotaxis protein [Sulfuricella sp.]|nr:methyl-accepting chemotaxis protein [Sulfuricella sp.]